MSIKVKDHPGLVRDPFSKAVVNVDQNSYNTYIEQRTRMQRQAQMITESKQEVDQLKQEVAEIKTILLQIASKLQGKE